MEFIIILVTLVVLLFIAFFVLPFFFFFITGLITMRKIEKKVENICIEYQAFVIHKNFATEHNIALTEPFAVTLESDNIIISTTKLSQLEYLGILKTLEEEIDILLAGTSSNLRSIPTLANCISYFNRVKQGIAEANPYS